MTDDKKTDKEFNSDIIVSALQLWKKIYDEKDVFVKFIKKNGSERTMRCTLDFTKIPKPHRPKTLNIKNVQKLIEKNKVVRVYDLEKIGWRSIPFERVLYLDTKTKRYYKGEPDENRKSEFK